MKKIKEKYRKMKFGLLMKRKLELKNYKI